MARFPLRSGLLLAMLPLVFTGKAFLRGDLYGPADLYYQHHPWKTVAAENGVDRIKNPILSDLAFANLPWRAAVREALVNGRLPFWNRFVLGGNPLLGTAQAAAFHPSTWLGIFLPVALSWTFSCAFTIFLALLAAYLFFREICRSELAALVGAVGWGFSTFVLFWDGWAVGPSIAAFPLLLLGLRRLARGGKHPIAVTASALFLSALGGHPETLFHSVAAAGVYFLWELFARDARARAGQAVGRALAAGLLAAGLAAPALLPLLEALPHSAEYAARRAVLARGRGRQSVPAIEAARRLRPAVLPFVHGIYGKSPVQDRRQDGSGMPLAYAGAVLFPLAAIGLASRERSRSIFAILFLAGLLYGASAPLLLDATARLPGFALALNYRLVFLAPFGLAGLAALGTDRVEESPANLAVGATAVVSVLMLAYILAVPVMRDRDLPALFTRQAILFEGAPVILLILAALVLPRRIGAAALVLLVGQRFLEMRGTYPTLPGRALAPRLATLSALRKTVDPYRIVAVGETFRPNASALYGLEDVRGYESLVLDRFAETYSLWCRPQHASFNRVDDLTAPFLSLLNARYAIGEPDASEPVGWKTVARERESAVFENPKALPRAFVPRRLRVQPDAKRRVEEMGSAESFEETAWLGEPPQPDPPAARFAGTATFGRGRNFLSASPVETPSSSAAEGEGVNVPHTEPVPQGEEVNGPARLTVREVGTDLTVEADVRDRALVATSLPDWSGWRARAGGRAIPLVTVNHAFVGFWLPPGRHAVRLHYLPGSFLLGLAFSGASIAAVSARALLRRRRGIA